MATANWFNYDFYMNAKLAQMVASDPTGGWTLIKLVQTFGTAGFVGPEGGQAHFEGFGQNEGLSPNEFFNPQEYYSAKAAEFYNKAPSAVTPLDAANIELLIKNAGMNAWSHYTAFGSAEGVNPSNSFDSSKYMDAKLATMKTADPTGAWDMPKLVKAFQDAGLSALEHFMMFGGTGPGEVAQKYDPAKPSIPAEFAVPESEKVNAGGGETFTLTIGTDTITGTSGNDIINASTGLAADGSTHITTTNALDKIDGGAGVDTLNIENTGGVNTLTGTITNVENLTFVGDGNVNNNADVDVGSFSGVVTLSQTTDTAVAVSNVTGQTLALNKVAAGTTLTATLGATQTSVTLSNAAAAGAATFSVAGAKLDTVNLTTDKTAGALTVADTGNTTKTANITASDTAAVTVNSTALENVTISGAGAVTLTAGTAPSKTLDASGSTGGVTYAVDMVAQQFTGSSAKDTVQFGATTKAQTLGAGDDIVTMSVAALGTGGSIDGGEGTDTISLSAANIATATSNATLGAAFQASISNFEKLGVGATSAVTDVDAQYIDGITHLVSAGTVGVNSLTVNNMAVNSTFEMTALAAAAVALNLKDNTGTADVMNLKFSATNGFTSTAAITVAGVETLNITTDDTDTTAPTTVFTAPITAAAVKTVVVTGDVGIDLTGLNATTLTSFDASGVTATGAAGAVTLVTGNLAADATIKGGAGNDVLDASAAVTKTVTIDGGAGNDTITGSASKVNTLNGGEGNDTITGGTAADTIDGGAGDDIISGGAGLDQITGGAGNDRIVVAKNSSGNIYATFKDAAAGDILDFAGAAAGAFNSTKIALASTAVFQDYLDAAAAGNATDDVSWFQFNGNTYVVQDNAAGATFDATADLVIELTGLIDLSNSTIDGAGTNYLTIA